MTTNLPDRIGLCRNRIGDSRYVVAGKFLYANDGEEEEICEHCGQPLVIYEQVRTSLTANDG